MKLYLEFRKGNINMILNLKEKQRVDYIYILQMNK